MITDPNKSLDECIAACQQKACQSESDIKNGCNQMFSCPHGCQIRHLGNTKDQCLNHCNRQGDSGCYPRVNDYVFNLCSSCNRDGCSSGWPSLAECEIGCANYGE